MSSRFFSFSVDIEQLTNEAYAFVIDPTPARNDREIVQALNDLNPDVVDVLECMVLDGTEERDDVMAFMSAVFAGALEPHRPDEQRST